MDLMKLSCPSCGGSLQLPDDIDQATCRYCQTMLVVQRGEGYASLKIAEKVQDAIRDSAVETRVAIEEGSLVTRDELRRMQLSQDLSATQARLASLQAEIRALEREKKKRKVKRQLKKLRKEEKVLFLQVGEIEKSIAARTPQAQAPQQPAASVPKKPKKPMSRSIKAILWGCGTYFFVGVICAIPAIFIDEALFAGTGSSAAPLLTFTSLAAFVFAGLAFIYVLTPDAQIWSSLRSYVRRPKSKKPKVEEKPAEKAGQS